MSTEVEIAGVKYRVPGTNRDIALYRKRRSAAEILKKKVKAGQRGH